jgi:tetratricopeptide (TPR) repeat protein
LLAKDDGKSPDSLTQLEAFKYYGMAIQKDSMPEDKNRYIVEATALAKTTGNKQAQAQLAELVYKTKKNPSQTDMYNWGFGYYQAGNYKTADSIFCGIYESQYPDQIYGYLWCSKSKRAEDDSLASQGIAVESWIKLIEMATKIDSIKYKTTIVQTHFYLAQYYNDYKKDKQAAIAELKKVLEIDPTNADAQKFLTILSAPPRRAASPAKKTS